MENTVRHPAPRQRSVRHRVARALTTAHRDTGAGGGGDVAGRGRPAARGPVGCGHAYTDPAACAVARDRDPRDGRVSV